MVAVATSPGGMLLLQLVAIGGVAWIYREGRVTRREIHTRINLALGRLQEHEVQCAERWGKVSTKLGIGDG